MGQDLFRPPACILPPQDYACGFSRLQYCSFTSHVNQFHKLCLLNTQGCAAAHKRQIKKKKGLQCKRLLLYITLYDMTLQMEYLNKIYFTNKKDKNTIKENKQEI